MKHKMSKLLSVLLCCVMLLTLLPVTAAAATADDWTPGYSKSKEATNLDENYESRVTLSLPSAEKQLETDVVFVLDESSCSDPVKAAVAKMLETLYKQVASRNAVIKIGAVQFRGEVTVLPLTKLTEDTKETVTTFMSNRPGIGGSNMSAGLLAGEKMLDNDQSVENNRKYLILVSDGITYIWDDESTDAQENYGVNYSNSDTPNKPMLAGPDGWDVKYGRKYVPVDWSEMLTQISALLAETVKEKASIYDRNADISDKPYVAYAEKDNYASTVDIALYKSYEAYTRIASKFNAYAVMAGEERDVETFPFGPSFMNYLAGGKTVSFDDIQNDILYLVDAGSYVEDYMGYVEGDYNFDFVNEAKALTMTVGGVTLETKKISDNFYGFGEKTDNGYPYELTYYPANDGTEHFVWTMNVPVSNLAHVQLTYTVKLKNPKTAADTYGQYDRYGSAGFDGLYTNNSAALYPKTTGSNVVGEADPFPQPTVSYTVATPTPRPSTSKPSTSKPISSPKTFDAGIALYGAMALLSLTGGAWVVNKKRSDK